MGLIEKIHEIINVIYPSVDTKHSEVGTMNSNVNTKHDEIVTMNENVNTKNTNVNSKSQNVDTKHSEVVTMNENVNTKNTNVDSKYNLLLSIQNSLAASATNDSLQLQKHKQISTVEQASSISVCGDYVAIGDEYNKEIRLYDISTMELLNTFVPSSTLGLSFYGQTVSIDDDKLATRSSKWDERIITIYSLEDYSIICTIPFAYTSANFAKQIKLHNGKVYIGATDHKNSNGETIGAVYIYDSTTGELLHIIENPNFDSNNSFYTSDYGRVFDVFGEHLAIGSSRFNNNSGVVDIWNINTFTKTLTLTNPNLDSTYSTDYFGENLALNSNYISILAPSEKTGNTYTAPVYTYNLFTGELISTILNQIPSIYSSNRWTKSLSVQGNKLLKVATTFDENGVSTNSTIYIFDILTGTKLIERETNFNSGFGFYIGLTKDKVISVDLTTDLLHTFNIIQK